MNTYPTKLKEVFASSVLKIFFQKSVADLITNRDYEGDIKNNSSILNVLTLGQVALRDYTGADITWDDISESNSQLVTDQQKYFGLKVKSIEQLKSFIKNPQNTLLDYAAEALKEAVDTHVLGRWSDAASGNWLGTSYTTGTVEVTTTTGAVVGTGTTFASTMVGKPFKALGHTAWYRVKTFTDATHIVIEDDSDDLTSAYTGGAIAAGATYEIQANAAVQVTKSNIYQKLVDAKTMMDKRKIPTDRRFAVLPADLANLFLGAPELTPAIADAYTGVVLNGRVGRVAGFDLYSNEQVAGDSTNGYHTLFGHTSAITYAQALTESDVTKLENNFGYGYKGLNVYGSKVADERRKALVHGLFKL